MEKEIRDEDNMPMCVCVGGGGGAQKGKRPKEINTWKA